MRKNFTLLAALALCAASSAFAENPAELYVVGQMNDWITPNLATEGELIVLSQTSDGIYEGTFNYDTTGELGFKIFTEKTDWSDMNANYGTDVYMEMMDGTDPVVWHMGTSNQNCYNDFRVSNWPAGNGTITVNWTDKTLSLVPENPAQGPAEEMYLVGSMNSWLPGDAQYRLIPDPDKNGLFQGTFNLPAGDIEFKFTADDTWAVNYGAYINEQFSLFNGVERYFSILEDGSNFTISGWEGGEVSFTLDIIGKNLTVVSLDAPSGPQEIHLVGAMNGWDFANLDYQLTKVEDSPGHYKGTFEISKDACSFRFATGTDGEKTFGAQDSFYSSFDLFRDMTIDGNLVEGGYGFSCANWQGGNLTIDIDFYNKRYYIWSDDAPATPELYLATNTNGWSNSNPEFKFEKSEWDPTFYSLTIDIPENGKFEFRLVDENDESLTYGAPEFMANGIDLWKYVPNIISAEKNGANFAINNWIGGTLSIDFQLSSRTVILNSATQPEEPVAPADDILYLVGSPQGWDINSSDIILTREGEGNVYTGTLNYDTDQTDIYFRFYSQLGNWDEFSIGSQEGDSPVEISIDPEYTGACVYGKGSWYVPVLKAGTTYLTVDLDNMTVRFSDKTVGVEAVISDKALRYENGVVKAVGQTSFIVVDAAGKVVMQTNGTEADLNVLGRGIYVVKAGEKTLKVAR